MGLVRLRLNNLFRALFRRNNKTATAKSGIGLVSFVLSSAVGYNDSLV